MDPDPARELACAHHRLFVGLENAGTALFRGWQPSIEDGC